MSPSELRIGNKILVRNTDSIVPEARDWTVEDCNIHHLKDLYQGSEDWEYKPIQLTEQWLIDFGMEMPTNEDPIFEHGEGKYDDPFNHFIKTSQSLIDASFEYDGKEFWADSEGFWFKIMHTYTHVEYVHQFQNLIFALTYKELTLQK